MRIRDIEDHLERCDARIARMEKIEAARDRKRLWALVIKLNVAIIAILCAFFAIYAQF